MQPIRSGPRAIILGLVLAVLIAASAPLVASVAAYLMGPPRAEPDPFILVLLAALTLGPSIVLGVATRRAHVVAPSWDLGRTGARVLIVVSAVIVIFLGIAGLYPVVRLLRMVFAH